MTNNDEFKRRKGLTKSGKSIIHTKGAVVMAFLYIIYLFGITEGDDGLHAKFTTLITESFMGYEHPSNDEGTQSDSNDHENIRMTATVSTYGLLILRTPYWDIKKLPENPGC